MSADGREQTEREKRNAAEDRATWYRTVLGETEARVRELTAENERLRAEKRATELAWDAAMERAQANEARLATAKGLLAECASRRILLPPALFDTLTAFLASAQPAAPTRIEAQLDAAIAAVKSYRETVARTEAEQAVLLACSKMALDDGNREEGEDPLEPSEHGEDCYIYTDDQYAIAKAELALRGLK